MNEIVYLSLRVKAADYTGAHDKFTFLGIILVTREKCLFKLLLFPLKIWKLSSNCFPLE